MAPAANHNQLPDLDRANIETLCEQLGFNG
jgi:hypothetical protein